MRYKLDWATQKYYVEIVDNICGTPEPYFNEMHYYWPIAQSRTQQNRTCCPTIRAGGNTLSLFCSLLRAADVARSSFFANLHSQTP